MTSQRNGHAIVVGASSGIGAAVTAALVREGWNVTALSRRGIGDGAARAIACDVTDEASVASALSKAVTDAGIPALVVYSAGESVAGQSVAVPAEVARRAFEVNFWGLERVVRQIYPAMAERGSGSIVYVSSIAGLRAVPLEAHYAASKAAATRFIETLALEASARGVHVGYVAPGYIPTGFLERAGWYGMSAPAGVSGSGTTVDDVARETLRLVAGRKPRVLIGWREKAIALGDRLLPGAYDRLLRARAKSTEA